MNLLVVRFAQRFQHPAANPSHLVFSHATRRQGRRTNADPRWVERLAFVEGLLKLLPVFEFTAETARVHAEIHASLRQRGALIGAHDLIVAATAMEHGCAVMTGNYREFNRVPGLEVIALEDP